MHLIAQKYLINIFLIVSMLGHATAQEKKTSFTWFDRSERKLAGIITANLRPQAETGLYQLGFDVVWYDKDGKPITGISEMPVLCLSKWGFDKLPDQQVRCTSFDLKKSDLVFQTAGELTLQVLNGYQGDIELNVRFQYAFSRELYESGRSEKIELPGNKGLKLTFPVNSRKPSLEADIVTGKNPPAYAAANSAAMRKTAFDFLKFQASVKGYEDRRAAGKLNQPVYIRELEAISKGISDVKAALNPDSLPSDSIRLYRDRYNLLNDTVESLLSHLSSRILPPSLTVAADPMAVALRNDSMRNVIRARMEPIVRRQLDSLVLITGDQRTVAVKINSLLSDAQIRNRDHPGIDSLILSHGSIKRVFLNLMLSHESAWSNYLAAIDNLVPVNEIEKIHSTFIRGQNELQSAIDQVDNNLASIVPRSLETPWYQSNLLLWTGLLAVFILVFVSAIWSTSRSRKILKERLSSLELGNPGGQGEKGQLPGIFTDEMPNEYFSVSYEETIPDSIVGKIHYHTSAIKSVYHLVQNAQLERKPGDFGGYLFGNQYKLHGKGAAKNEIFIEKACDSRYLRSSITNDVAARADLVDELDELVRQNSKYRLIGWFTASADNSLEISEGLMKIHRSFFKEKWQIGILLNPGSEVLLGASFLRRRSGYLDPMPDPAAFVKWDELYRFALNPGPAAKNAGNGYDREGRDYSRIAFSNTWADSVVAAVNFDLAVVAEIKAVAALHAIPKDTYQVVGYLYGTAVPIPAADGRAIEYEVFVDRFIELSNELVPRDLPGLSLIGWWGQANVDVMTYLQNAVDYHEQSFREAFHISCLANPSSGELRIFTRKHSLEMNNSTIETEEYSLKNLLSR